MGHKQLFILVIALVLLGLVGCRASNVVSATAVDWVWGVEELESGAVRVWLRYDDLAGYCTADQQLAAQAKEMTGELVKITFVSRHPGDDEYSFWGASGCDKLYLGSESSTPIFKLTSIERLDE